jgi:hypothetical protein
MHEDGRLKARKDKIRTPGQRLIVEPIPQSGAMQRGPQQDFDAGVFLADTRHNLRPGLAVDCIHSDPPDGESSFERFQMPDREAQRLT